MQTSTPPAVSSQTPSTDYLAEALRRAGRTPIPSGAVQRTQLHGGRTGASVERLQCTDGSTFVLKTIPQNRAFRQALGHEGEADAWLSQLTRNLPSPLANPTLDVALHAGRDEWWMLMEDVSEGIVGRDDWSEEYTRRLFEAVAGLHATYWDVDDAHRSGLGTMAGTTSVFVEIARYVITEDPTTSWVEEASREFQVPGMLMADFLDAAGVNNADFYEALLRRWPEVVAALDARRPTILHGDLRRANIAFVDHQIVLFDWELCARGPAAADLTWHWFLRYWSYPPDDTPPGERLWLRDAYLENLEEALGRSVDRDDFSSAWDLGWLRVFSQLGCLLADGLDGEDATRRVQLIQSAFEKAKRLADDRL